VGRRLPGAVHLQDYDHFQKVVTGPVGKELMAAVEGELGVKPLFIVQHASFRRITNSARAIHKPEDMKGLKIRDPNVPAYSVVYEGPGRRACSDGLR